MAVFSWIARGLGLTPDRGSAQLVAALGGEPTDAGETVTVDTAMQLATVWACVRLISETVATLPLFLYRKGPRDSRDVASNESLYGVLHDSPHADYTAVEFWEGVVASLCLWGNSYAEKQMSGDRLIGLEPLRCDLMEVLRDRNGARVYRYHDTRGRRDLTEDQVFHVRGFGNGGDVGLSPISFARHSLGTAKAADKTSAKMFANGIRPTGVLQMDQILKPEQRKMVQDNIVAPLAGSANAGGVFVLEAGMKFNAVTINPHDAEMLASRGFHVEEICRWFRVPPVMVGHGEKQTSWGTGVEQQMIGFLTFALRPYLARIEQAIRRSLIPAGQRSTLYAEFAVEGLLRADSQARADFYSKALGAGGSPAWMTVDEIRGLENWPAMGGDSAVLPKPTNVAKPVSALPQG